MITIKYKCKCMQDEGSFELRERRHNEEVGSFMDRVVAALSADHRKRSALCTQTKMEYLKVPVEDGTPIGGKATRQ